MTVEQIEAVGRVLWMLGFIVVFAIISWPERRP